MAGIVIELSEPVVFPGLNAKEQKADNFARGEIIMAKLKYKHFRNAMKLPEEEQMHQMMKDVTGLSDDELDELSTDDTAAISAKIYDSIRGYMDLGQRIIGQTTTTN